MKTVLYVQLNEQVVLLFPQIKAFLKAFPHQKIIFKTFMQGNDIYKIYITVYLQIV